MVEDLMAIVHGFSSRLYGLGSDKKRSKRRLNMAKVTRMVYGKDLNSGKRQKLTDIAERLGDVRQTVWHRLGCIAGGGVKHRAMRDQWVAETRGFGLPARLWTETRRETRDDIELYQEAANVKVREAIRRHTQDKAEQQRLDTLLKYNRWAWLLASCEAQVRQTRANSR